MSNSRLALAVLLLGAALPAAAQELIIEDVTVVSPEREQPLRSQHVLIRDGRIAQVSAARILGHAAARRIKAAGEYLTPGIMDSHVHVGEVPGLPLGTTDPSLLRLREQFVKQEPRSYLYFGVTQVLDMLGRAEQIAQFEAQPEHPDVFKCGAAIVLDGYPSLFAPKSVRYQLLPDYIYEPANAKEHPLPPGADEKDHTPEAVVAKIAASGARCVKTFIEDGFGPRSDWPLMSRETLARLRAAATRHKLLLIAHANAIDMQRIALEAGVDVLAHGLWNWNELDQDEGIPEQIAAHLRRIQAQHIGYQPTLRVIAGTADLFRADTLKDPTYAKVVPPALLAWYGTEAGQWYKNEISREFGGAPGERIARAWLQTGERGMRASRYLHGLGHPLLLGSDTPSAPTYGNQPGYDTYREMRLMAQSGIPLAHVLRAATISNAKQFGLDRDYGTVSPGKIANLLLLKANPLESLMAWEQIDKIILRGKVIERESLAADQAASPRG
ncbi:MAG TPA: amidohydrolase family protein [Steroidobacteraceae bacterium]